MRGYRTARHDSLPPPTPCHPPTRAWGRNLFEWGQTVSGELLQAIPHSRAAVAVSQYFANFFVDECRASAHRFASPTDQWKHLIYYSPQWLALPTSHSPNFVESYVFDASQHDGTRNRTRAPR